MTTIFIFLDYSVLVFFWWQPDLRCSPAGQLSGKGPSHEVSAQFMLLILIICELISLVLNVMMVRCHSHQEPLGRLSAKTEELHLSMRHGYSLQDANPVFIYHGVIIYMSRCIIIVIINIVLINNITVIVIIVTLFSFFSFLFLNTK